MYHGTGIYSVPETSRLIAVPNRDIRRWLFGYHYRKTPGDAESRVDIAPLWKTELADEHFDEQVIGFHDLLELRFIREFMRNGISLSVVRRCLNSARQLYGVSRPMTLPTFMTDGKTIYAEALSEERNATSMVDLKSRQTVFKDIIKPSLYSGIEYDGNKALKWYPERHAKRSSPVVIDPTRQFGAPIIEETGTPTSVLFASFLAEGADHHAQVVTARVYGTTGRHVEAAIRFEERLQRIVH
jgi:uncharacterized protein (DUF433 family)